ncbi:MAG: hypothetical protein ACI37Q_06615 [Candidatus Gastranaerophilaceae bacterium]
MYKFLEKPINIKELPKEITTDPCLLENNEKQIGQICDFLNSEKQLLLINGFRGSGKSQVANFTLGYSVASDVIVLHYTCLETTILDDMLLSFFDHFKTYTAMGMINTPKIKVENFTQKINSYFNTITKPVLIVIDSFEAIVKENRNDILNFLKHLLNYANIKMVVISKSNSSEVFAGIDYEKVTILAFSQKLFEKYLKEHGIKQIGVLSNELYKLSKGYYNFLDLTVKIINLRQISLVNFLELYSKSYMAFPEFILREALSLIDPISAHLFRLLTIMRIPIHINLLKSLHLYEQERVLFYISNSLLSIDGECLYLKDYYREILENQIPENVMIKLHSACIDLYNTQLPLKPVERDLMLSRQTMRNEIEYHSMFIPKKPVFTTPVQIPGPAELAQKNTTEEKQTEDVKTDLTKEETKEEKLNKISFIIEDEVVLDNIADSIKDYIVTTSTESKFEKESSQMNLTQLLNTAKQEEQKYNFKRVVTLYQNALTKTDDDDFYTFLPVIYTKLAKAYQNLQDWYEALEYYTQAQDFYVNVADNMKVFEIKLEIANIYYIMYKYDNAKFILSELEKSEEIPNQMRIKVNLALAKMSDDINVEYKYYKKSLSLINLETDKMILSELFYKYAATSDEVDDLRSAAEYYKKCIDIDSNPKNNPYLSMALSNLAELYDEAGNTTAAIKYYGESIKIDTMTNNYNGLYNSSIHLAEIFASKDDNKALEYMNNALSYAKELKEPFYIAGASLELGDFYFLRRNNELAYKYFISAFTVAKNSFSKENIDKITSRLEDVKLRIGENEYAKLQDKYGR